MLLDPISYGLSISLVKHQVNYQVTETVIYTGAVGAMSQQVTANRQPPRHLRLHIDDQLPTSQTDPCNPGPAAAHGHTAHGPRPAPPKWDAQGGPRGGRAPARDLCDERGACFTYLQVRGLRTERTRADCRTWARARDEGLDCYCEGTYRGRAAPHAAVLVRP